MFCCDLRDFFNQSIRQKGECKQIVEADDVVSVRQETVAQMRADKSGPSRDKDTLFLHG